MVLWVILSVVLIGLQVLDVLLTSMILKGGGVELNPFIRKYGYWIKIPAVVILIVAGFLLHPAILILPVIIFVGACSWNLYQLLRRM